MESQQTTADQVPTAPVLDLAELDRIWRDRYPGCLPLGHLLRHAWSERWVRFHSLPGSKRYPDTEGEYALLLGRQHTVLSDLDAPSWLLVITCAWDESPSPVGRKPDLEAMVPATYWCAVVADESAAAGDRIYSHLYVSVLPNTSDALDPLLRAVADWRTADVILAPATLDWLVHPYDGGIDVIAPSTAERETLKAKHRDWLSLHPSGQ
ncbi:hypothetical protein GCM10009760_01020 [Kitasatospora kazusensis]|uniref:DUF3885 domain-containing protein n=1 Tax=Kitasatospora kazusensis TaxID=407974 RepID=A0ABN2YMC1_9ACTN